MLNKYELEQYNLNWLNRRRRAKTSKKIIKERLQCFSNIMAQNRPMSEDNFQKKILGIPSHLKGMNKTHYKIEVEDYGYKITLIDKIRNKEIYEFFHTNFLNINLRLKLKEILEENGYKEL